MPILSRITASNRQFTLAVWALFAVLTVAASLIRPEALTRLHSSLDRFYDAEHYVTIARTGYIDSSITAFFPLWPWSLRVISFLVGVTERNEIAIVGCIVATLVFFATVALFIRMGRERFDANVLPYAVMFFVFNPFSLFRVLPFTESLCTLLLLYLLICIQKPNPKALPLLALATLTSLSRPVWAFLPFAAGGAYLLARFFGQKPRGYPALAIAIGAIVGLTVFCIYLEATSGNAFATFHAQETWGRKLGLYWQLIYAPQSVGGSSDVLIWDLLAFWGPILLVTISLALALLRRARHRNRPIDGDFSFWFAALFSFGHALAAFLSYPVFASLGRHVFGTPMFTYAIGLALGEWRPSHTKARVLLFAVLFGVISYCRWWARFAKGSWVG